MFPQETTRLHALSLAAVVLGLLVLGIWQVIGIPFLFVPGMGLVVGGLLSAFLPTRSKENRLQSRALSLGATALFWTVLAALLLQFFYTESHRAPSHFALIGVAAGSLSLSILSCNTRRERMIVLLHLMVFAIFVRASSYWLFPGIVGIDPVGHRHLVSAIAEGGLVELDLDIGAAAYVDMPVFHLMTVTGMEVLAIGYKESMFATTTLPVVFLMGGLYLVCRRLTSPTPALIGILLLLLADYSLRFGGFYIVPMSYSIALFCLVVILFFVLSDSRRAQVLALLAVVAIAHTHSMGATFLLAFLFFTIFGLGLYRPLQARSAIRNQFFWQPEWFIGSSFIILLTWMTAQRGTMTFFGFLLGSMDRILLQLMGGAEREASQFGLEMGLLDVLLSQVGFMLIIVFATVAVAHLLSDRDTDVQVIMFIAGTAGLLGLGATLFLTDAFALVSIRFVVFAYLGLCPLAGYGLWKVIQPLPRFVARPSFIIAIGCFAFFMVSSPAANMDSPFYSEGAVDRSIFSPSERNAIFWIDDNFDGETLFTDGRYRTLVLSESPISGRFDTRVITIGVGDLSTPIIWRGILEETSAQVMHAEERAYTILGSSYYNRVQDTSPCVYDTGTLDFCL